MNKMLNALLLVGAMFTTSALFISCEDDPPPPPDTSYTLSGNASGAQEVPPVSTAAGGTITGNYNSANNTLQFSIGWTGLSGTVSGIHFHGPAPVGTNAGIMIDLGPNITSNAATGAATGTITLTDAQETNLLNGQVYYNIHTAANPNGEIRGQVTATL